MATHDGKEAAEKEATGNLSLPLSPPHSSQHACSKEGPREDLMRRRLSVHQEEASHQELNQLAP